MSSPAPTAGKPVAAVPATPAAPADASPLVEAQRAICTASRSALRTSNDAKIFWNDQIAKPTNQAIRDVNVEFQKVRQTYPGPIVFGATASVFAFSLFRGGARSVLRNTVFAGLFTGMAVAPTATIGTLAWTRDRLAAASGVNRPSTVVVQQQTAAPVVAAAVKKQ